MGLIMSKLTLKNARNDEISELETEALVDTGCVYLCIPQRIQIQLKLDQLDTKVVTVATEQQITVPYVGPIQVKFKNRSCIVGAIVMGDEVLLGAIPMEDMDVILIPNTQTIDVNPESPNIACGKVKKIEHGLDQQIRT